MCENQQVDRLPRFYLGAVTPKGYIFRADQLHGAREGWRTYILKGCPGSGKEEFLHRLAAELVLHYQQLELIACASGSGELDGLVVHDIGVNVVGGSYPHPLDTRVPCAYDQIIPLEDWEGADLPLENRREIARLWTLLQENALQCQRVLQAAASLLSDACQLAREQTDFDKIQRFAVRMAARELPRRQKNRGKESVCYLSSLTGEGIVTLEDTPLTLCGQIIHIRDEWGAASGATLAALREEFLAGGCDVITCYCPLFPDQKIDHLLVPELGLAILSQNKFLRLQLTPDRTIHAQRFTNVGELRKYRARISWDHKAAREMLEHAADLLARDEEIYERLRIFGRESGDQQRLDKQLYSLFRSLLELGPPNMF